MPYNTLTHKKLQMTKVVYSSCYGGFGLSKEAVQRYWEIKGQRVWIEEDNEFHYHNFLTVWLVSPEERQKQKSTEEFLALSMNERIAYNDAYLTQTWCAIDVDRHDPVLVQVVEELGDKANGQYAKLAIKEVSGPYRITEYDGYETVETPADCDWKWSENENTKKLVEKWSKVLNSQNKNRAMLIEPMETLLYND